MGSASKIKGASAERQLGKILSETFGGTFIRSNSSGAIVGGSNIHRKQHLGIMQLNSLKGDLAPPDHMPKFVIESKHYADFPYHQFLSSSIPLLDNWIEQVLTIVDENDFWIVAFKTDRKPWAVVFDYSLLSKFKLDRVIRYKNKNGNYFGITGLEEFITNKETILKLSA